MSERVRITDVAPRDGLQNEPGVIPTEEKAELVRLLCETGVDEVEVTSFVSAKWVPQLSDASDLIRSLFPQLADAWRTRHYEWPCLSVLVPNLQGLSSLQAIEKRLSDQLWSSHGQCSDELDTTWMLEGRWISKISIFTAASETFNRRNTNVSIAESIERFRPIVAECMQASRRVRGYISCAIACPFEGPIPPRRVAAVARSLVELGVDEIDLGDTIGAADVASTTHLLEVIREELPGLFEPKGRSLTLHLHDTRGRAVECVKAALDLGVRSFDGSAGGLGGCPYASTATTRAPGNISTQALVRAVHAAGFTTGVDLSKLDEAARFATKIVADARRRAGGGETPP